MKNVLLAIAWTTVRSALRSHVVHVLLFVVGLVVFVLPLTVMTDGSAQGLIQVSLTYSLGMVGVLLSMVTLWLGCIEITDEIECYQAHLVLSKPVSRTKFWLGKLLGILILQGAILLVAATSIYALTMWRFKYGDYKPAERAQIRSELLTGRKLIPPQEPPVDQFAMEELQKRLNEGLKLTPGMTKEMVLSSIRRDIQGKLQEVKPGMWPPRAWVFRNLPDVAPGEPIFLRFRLYVDSATSKDQRLTAGRWWVVDPIKKEPVPQTQYGMEQYMGGIWHQLKIDPAILQGQHELVVAYENLEDPYQQGKSVIFQLADGPFVMLPATGFLANFSRVVLLIFCQIVFLAIIGCVCGALMSTPVAIFVAYSYVLIGAVVVAMQPATPDEAIIPKLAILKILYYFRIFVGYLIVSVNEFNQVSLLSKGQLIEWASIGMVVLKVLVLRGLPIALLGNWLLKRRELGLVVRR